MTYFLVRWKKIEFLSLGETLRHREVCPSWFSGTAQVEIERNFDVEHLERYVREIKSEFFHIKVSFQASFINYHDF